jgi:prolyl oligopeptidase
MGRISKFGLVTGALCLSAATVGIHYPEAPKSTQTDIYHGVVIADPYRGLEDADSAATQAWVEKENELTRSILDRVPGQEEIKKDLTALWDFEKYTAPFHVRTRYFYTHNTGLQNQSVVFTLDRLGGTPKELIDPNTYRADGTAALSGFQVSWDGNLAAYGIAQAGSDWVEWHVREVASRKDLPDVIHWSKGGLSWAPDDKGFYYSRFPEPSEKELLTVASLNQKVYFHKLGDPQSADVMVYERSDHPDWTSDPIVTEGGRYLFLSIYSGVPGKNLLSYRDLTHGDGKIIDLITTAEGIYAPLAAIGSTIYMQTTDGAHRGRIVAVDLNHPEKANWKVIVPERAETLDGAQVADGKILLAYMKDAHSTARLVTLDGKAAGEVEMPGIGSASWADSRLKDRELFFHFGGYTIPPANYRLDLQTAKVSLVNQSKVAFDSAAYETKQVFFASKDGTRVPMFICSRKGIRLDGQNRTILYGYGGFAISETPDFSPAMIEWMKMGGVYVTVNLRGGSEYGEAWHQAGMRAKKQNVFDDFIAAAENLIAMKYTSTPKLAIFGGSNGGLLVGAVLNQRPDLFGAAMPAVGVMDMLRFQKFGFGTQWTGEFGSAENADDFPVLRAYSPLHNIRKGVYPATLITTADHDDRVMPGHSLKYAATLQQAQEGKAPILIRIETRAGHGAGKPTSKQIDEWVDRFAFLRMTLGRE